MSDVVEVARFDNPFEAHRVVAVLAAAGVEAEVADEHTGAALPHILAIGVRVVVAREDVERARAALAEDAAERRARRERGEADEEDDDDLDDEAFGDDAESSAAPDEDEATATGPSRASAAAPTEGRRPLTEEEAVAWATRTRAIAFVGVAVVILAVGALWRTLSVPDGVEASPRARALLRQARIATWGGIGLFVLLLLLIGAVGRR
ncbi:MAG: DUF2007 domain-containing protein [Planctomycetes bacterium]|nr:DUF2007 domain-containing protein [Planctomycetota bacterium]